MVDTLRQRLRHLQKNGNRVTVVYGKKNSEILEDVVITAVKQERVQILRPGKDLPDFISLKYIKFIEY